MDADHSGNLRVAHNKQLCAKMTPDRRGSGPPNVVPTWGFWVRQRTRLSVHSSKRCPRDKRIFAPRQVDNRIEPEIYASARFSTDNTTNTDVNIDHHGIGFPSLMPGLSVTNYGEESQNSRRPQQHDA